MTSRLRPWAVVVLLMGPAGCPARASQTPSPGATPSPSPTPPPSLRRAVEEQVGKLIEREARGGVPRFETSIEVIGKTPQLMIERFFGGVDLECLPAGVGAPSVAELGEARPTPPPTADLLALAQLMAAKLPGKGKGPDRYFLYRVRRGVEVSYDLRERKVPVTWLYGINGTTFELLEGFQDRETAVRGLRRMERGIPGPIPTSSGTRPPWAVCRPRP
jgi:hypothetical protein